MEIYLLRHAESISNEAEMADSQIDAGLSPKGQKDAQSLVNDLKKIKPDIFYVSSLKRTKLTIQPYLDTLSNPTVIEDELLLERDLGEFTGTSMGVFQKYCYDNDLNKVTTRPPGGESLIDVYERAQEFLSKIRKNNKDKTILICGHKNNLKCLQIAMENKDMQNYYSYDHLKPGELRKVEEKPPKTRGGD